MCRVQTLPLMRQVQSMHQLLCAQKEGFLFDNSDMQVMHSVYLSECVGV
jgi:hypothetical protein